jgi:hypothetical protein
MIMLSRRGMLSMAISTSFLWAAQTAFCIPVAVNEQRFVPIGGIDQ